MIVEEGGVQGSCTVRRVRAEEWQSLRELRLEALRDPIAHLAYLERLEPDYIGERSPHLRAALVGVYVRPVQRGGGVLQTLLSETEAWLQEIGVQQVRLHVNEHNVRAQGAYRKCGYVDTGTRVEMIDGVNHEMARAFAYEATA